MYNLIKKSPQLLSIVLPTLEISQTMKVLPTLTEPLENLQVSKTNYVFNLQIEYIIKK